MKISKKKKENNNDRHETYKLKRLCLKRRDLGDLLNILHKLNMQK